MTFSAHGDHWSSQYLNIPYAEADCADLCERVQREVFNREITLPKQRGSIRELSRLIEQFTDEFATPRDVPEDGDGVLIKRLSGLTHIGVWCQAYGQPYVLHTFEQSGFSCRHATHRLASLGLSVHEVYAWLD